MYNCHTYPGRMGAYCEVHDRTFCVSKNEVERCSHDSEVWIRGFLCGNEPPPPCGPDGEGIEDLDDPRWDQWRLGLQRFRERGWWPDWSITGTEQDHVCVVCGFPHLKYPPRPPYDGRRFKFCPSCGYHFGISDEEEGIGYATWRGQWVADDMAWQGPGEPPTGWDPAAQLAALRARED